MRAAVVDRYGPPEQVRITELPTPQPRPGQILLRVEAAAVTSGDARMRAGRFPPGFGLPARLAIGLRGPRASILGVAVSGRVESVGSGATGFAVGDDVAGRPGMRLGGHAEFVAVPAPAFAPKPLAVSHADAAGALFGGSTALYFLRDRAGAGPGQRVLVNGASGSVGSAAVQLAAHFGAEVTAVTSSRNRELTTRLGAQHHVDYARTPAAELSEKYDVVFDAVGNLSRADGLRLLAPDGSLILAVASLLDMIRARGQVIAGTAPERAADAALLLDLVASGRFDPVVEALGGLETLSDAYRRIDSGRKVGNLVILPQQGADPNHSA